MSASLSDILTTQKNGVIAINNLASYLLSVYNNITTVQLCQTALTTSVSTLYTSSSGASSHVNSINICNTTSSAINVYLFFVPSGGAAGTGNAIFYNTAVPAGTTVLWESTQIIGAGATIQGYASAAGVTVTISGGSST